MVGELDRGGQAEPERRGIHSRLLEGVGHRTALRRLLHGAARGIRQPPVDAVHGELGHAGGLAQPIAEPREVGEDDLDVGTGLVHERKLPALVVPWAVRPHPQLPGRPGVERSGCLEPAYLAEQAFVRHGGARVHLVAGRSLRADRQRDGTELGCDALFGAAGDGDRGRHGVQHRLRHPLDGMTGAGRML